jgi:hypothetical protein
MSSPYDPCLTVRLGNAKSIKIQHHPCGHLEWLVCYKNYVKCKEHEYEMGVSLYLAGGGGSDMRLVRGAY